MAALTAKEIMIELNNCKHDGYVPFDRERRCEAIGRAMAAVEKAEKGLPTKKCGVLLDGVTLCPTCRRTVVDQPNYCQNCGQRLLWDDFGKKDRKRMEKELKPKHMEPKTPEDVLYEVQLLLPDGYKIDALKPADKEAVKIAAWLILEADRDHDRDDSDMIIDNMVCEIKREALEEIKRNMKYDLREVIISTLDSYI